MATLLRIRDSARQSNKPQPLSVFYCRVAAAAAPTASQKAATSGSDLEAPGIGGQAELLPESQYASGVRIRGADRRPELLWSTLQYAARQGPGARTSVLRRRDRRARGALKSALPSPDGRCQALLGRGELSASFSGSTMASSLPIRIIAPVLPLLWFGLPSQVYIRCSLVEIRRSRTNVKL